MRIASFCSKRSKLYPMIVITFGIKFAISLISPLSFYFRNIVQGSSFIDTNVHWQGIYTFSTYFMNFFYRLWLLIPIPHPSLQDMIGSVYFNPSLPAYTLVGFFKFPIVLMDLLTGFLIYKIVLAITNSRDKSLKALLIWLLNPYNIIVINMISSMDIIGTLFFIVSIYALIKDRFLVSACLLSVSIIARFYPLLLLPFLLIYIVKKHGMKKFLLYLSTVIGVFIIFSAPYILSYGTDFFNWLYNLPLMGPKGHPEFTGFYGHVSKGFVMPFSQISFSIIIYFIILIIYTNYKSIDKIGLLNSVFLILITFVTFSIWRIYTSIWLVPFLTIFFATNRGFEKKSKMILLTLFFFSLYFSFGFFNGLDTIYLQSFRESLESFRNIFYQNIIPEDFFTTFFRSIIMSFSLIFLGECFFNSNIFLKSK